MSRAYGFRDGDSDGGSDGAGGAAGKKTLTSRLPAVQRTPAEPIAAEDHDEDEEQEEAGADADELDDPFALHLPKPVQMKAEPEPEANAKKTTKKQKGKKKRRKKGKYDRDADDKDSLGNLTESERGNKSSSDKENVFHHELEVLKDAKVWTSQAKEVKGRTIAKGTRVHFHKVGNFRARFSTVDGSVSESEDLWLLCKDVGGTGNDVRLGNGDEEDQARAAQIMSTLPPGRSPGQSKHTWTFGKDFHPSILDVALDGGLMSKIHRLIEWALYNDMVTGNITFTWGVRSPKDAHKFNVAYEIRQGNVSLDDLKALPDGEDAFGNKWYKPGYTLEQVQEWIAARGLGNNPAASGYPRGDKRRRPAQKGKMGISEHCSGHAVDVNIPWRSRDGEGTDVWAWEEIYHQFGLTRPLHRDRGGSRKPESWHVEETGKALDTEEDLGIDMGVFSGIIDL